MKSKSSPWAGTCTLRHPARLATGTYVWPLMTTSTHLLALDEAAFPPHWRMPAGDFRRALRRAASFTVLELEGVIRACQITTRDRSAAHLSRLAVHPDHQGLGHGSRMLADVMRRCRKRGLTSLSVNTQRHNRRSLRLYRRLGFRHTGPDYQVWSQRIPEIAAAK